MLAVSLTGHIRRRWLVMERGEERGTKRRREKRRGEKRRRGEVKVEVRVEDHSAPSDGLRHFRIQRR